MNAWFVIAIIALILLPFFVVSSIIDNKNSDTMDQIGPWGFWITSTTVLATTAAGVVYYIFTAYTMSALVVVAVIWFFGSYWIENYTFEIPSNEAWGFSDEFFAPTYAPTGGKKWHILKGGRKAWFPWNAKVVVVKLTNYATPEMDIELEPTDNTSTMNAKFSSTYVIKNVQDYLQAASPEKVEGFVSKQIQSADAERIQTFISGKHTAEELRKKGPELMAKMLEPPLQPPLKGGLGPLIEEARYGVKVLKVTLEKVDFPDDVRDANNAIAVSKKLFLAAAAASGFTEAEFKALPEETKRHWYRQAQLSAEVDGVTEVQHNVTVTGVPSAGGLVTPVTFGGAGMESIVASVLTPKPGGRK